MDYISLDPSHDTRETRRESRLPPARLVQYEHVHPCLTQPVAIFNVGSERHDTRFELLPIQAGDKLVDLSFRSSTAQIVDYDKNAEWLTGHGSTPTAKRQDDDRGSSQDLQILRE